MRKKSSCLETVLFCDAKHAKESFSGPEVIITNGSIIFLTGRVQYVYLDLLAVQNHFLPVGIGLRRLVIDNKLVVHKLQG